MNYKLQRYACLAALSIPVLLGGWAAVAQPKPNEELVIVTWGGSLGDQLREVLFRPFTAQTGIRIREDTGPQIERSRAEVQSGKPSYDTTATNLAFFLIGEAQNLWEPIDYTKFDPRDLEALPADVRLPNGIGAYVYAHGMSFSAKAFPEGKPQPNSWADFWDVAKFPGKRTLADCGSATRPVPEAALLADGVPMDKLYPIDIPRAAKKLKELAPHVVWWKNPNQPGQFLATGEVTMAMAPTNRIQALIDQNVPLKIVWNQSQWTFDIWYILRGARNSAAASRFFAFASQPEQQAKFAAVSAMAPTNPRAIDLIKPEVARTLPTSPENFKVMYKKNEAWWEANREKWTEACLAALTP
ncbi:ABC transporter substrate-binding protein [Bosea sp. (in: a-proteobacteria)]|uniref:ABC transporter substrate-binding protein n=1 Tax=Bosea sp. (in: a-proteobacteria) TaxID=1871050 RepID=UPI002602C96C|nr:ABC transporter substrate-binding protein [Bosea sp. (in: a-proteobacteria)]MCO5089780.1 ABC transporter substrate-binding protein [Bosea sp. (in: a-proteobacteria)]